MTLNDTMETMHAAGRRTLPPVPRPAAERAPVPAGGPGPDDHDHDTDTPTERFLVDLTTGEQRAVGADEVDVLGAEAGTVTEPCEPEPTESQPTESQPTESQPTESQPTESQPAEPVLDDAGVHRDGTGSAPTELDLAQQFVARLRAAAADFAEAAGAESAVVREAVPPARHRRARCRVVFRYTDDTAVDITFLGPAGLPGRPSRHGFDRQIRRWLTAGQRREDAWLVADPDAPDGTAVDLSAWAAAA